ncbi:helix-turn-helix domain-containing protein [Solitalea sp. MAHUQ-68]|uniref:Helix-turn-helix domain-containing protein n=1 Tax=Solitalea agri TaxID=2953739 RepID=A0A9X2F9I5_9SPHI|nr:helix-turn-helix domain-containing protein [Solitalea agri]
MGSNIKWLRKRVKKSQTELAEQLNVSRAVINSYEHNIAKPPLELLVTVADYFGLSTDTLLRTNLATYHELPFRELLEAEKIKKKITS